MYTLTYANTARNIRDLGVDETTTSESPAETFEGVIEHAIKVAAGVAELGTDVIVHDADGERVAVVKWVGAVAQWLVTDYRGATPVTTAR